MSPEEWSGPRNSPQGSRGNQYDNQSSALPASGQFRNGHPIEQDINIGALLHVLWRRKVVIIAALVMGISSAALYLTQVVPTYETKANVLIADSGRATGIADVLAPLTGLKMDTASILNEAERLRSRSMAKRIIFEAELFRDPEFNPYLKKRDTGVDESLLENMPESIDGYSNNGSTGFKSLRLTRTDKKRAREAMPQAVLNAVISRYLKHLRVRVVSGTHVIQIFFTSSDPEKAASITNLIARTYVRVREEESEQAIERVRTWLERKIATLQQEMRRTDARIVNYRVKHDLTDEQGNIATNTQMRELLSRLSRLRDMVAERKARLEQIHRWQREPDKIEAVPEVLSADTIIRFKDRVARLEQKQAELSMRYGDKHPQMQQVRSQLDKARDNLDTEVTKIARAIRNEYNIARERLKSLQKDLDKQRQTFTKEQEAMIGLRELARAAETFQVEYETYLRALKSLQQNQAVKQPEARIISAAFVPVRPEYPNSALILSLAGIMSIFAGAVAAFLLESLSNAIRTAARLEAVSGYSCFSLIPSAKLGKRDNAGGYVLSKPASMTAEAVRSLCMLLKVRGEQINGFRPKIVTLTSSIPGEGKSTLATWMGRLSAKSGERVLVIDCDLRRPTLHKLVGKKPENTLIDYLSDRAQRDQIIEKDEDSGADFIFARSVPDNAQILLSSEKMKNLLTDMREVYDLILLDTPGSLTMADPRTVALMSDFTLYVVKWNSLPEEVIQAGTKQYRDLEYQSLATVLSNVDLRRHARYGYGDAVYYYARYGQYEAD